MFPRRPHPGEKEEDLLRAQDEFVGGKKREDTKIQVSTDNSEIRCKKKTPDPPECFVLKSRIVEREISTDKILPPSLKSSSLPFPKPFRSHLLTSGRDGRSLFARSFKKSSSLNESSSDTSGKQDHSKRNAKLESRSCKRSLDSKSLDPSMAEVRGEIQRENLKKMKEMSEEEILDHQKSLMNSLDPKIIAFLKKNNPKENVESPVIPAKLPEDHLSFESDMTPVVGVAYDNSEQKFKFERENDSKEINNSLKKLPEEELLGSQEQSHHDSSKPMDTNSIPGEKNAEKTEKITAFEKEKTQWMRDIEKPQEPVSYVGLQARFNFKGEIMEGSQDDDVCAGLHHHGEEPHRAGYTVDELLTLSRSTFPQQKVLALETLGAIVRNYKRGAFDGIFENMNFLDSLLKSGIIEILRIGMDEKTESVIFPSCQTLSEFIYNDLDEICLDLTFTSYMGFLQPSLPSEISKKSTKAYAEYQEEKEKLKDDEVLQLDVILALLRMDILDRIAYIIDTLHPGVGVIVSCLKLLIRIARHSQFSARSILFHSNLLKKISHYFLPSNVKSHSKKRFAIIQGSPVHYALKLIRIIISWDRNYAVFVSSEHKIGEALLSYLAYDPISPDQRHPEIPLFEGFKLILEAFRFWQILLRYKLCTKHYLDFYPILIRQLLYYVNKVDVNNFNSDEKYTYDHGSALIQTLEAAVLNMESRKYSLMKKSLDWTHFAEMLPLLEVCARKWTTQLSDHKWPPGSSRSSKVSALNLLATTMRTISVFYLKYSEQTENSISFLLENHVRVYIKETLNVFFGSKIFQDLIESSTKTSCMMVDAVVDGQSGKNRDPANLPSFGSILYRGIVVPCIGENSPYNVLASAFYSFLLCAELTKSGDISESLINTLKSNEKRLICFIRSCRSIAPIFNANWFTRIEAYFWTTLTLVYSKLKVEKEPEVLRLLGTTALTLLHTWDEELALNLCEKVIFNKGLLMQECITDRFRALELSHDSVSEEQEDFASLYSEVLFHSKAGLGRSENIFIFSSVSGFTQDNSGELLVPWDWTFLPLLAIHNSRRSLDSVSTEKEIFSTRSCLKWIALFEDNYDCYPVVIFSRLCVLFLAAPDLFLDVKVKVYSRNIFKNILLKWKQLDLASNIPGGQSFFALYEGLLKQYSAVSYGDSLFTEFITLPIAMRYPSKYRFAFWSGHFDDLRIMTLSNHTLKLEEFLYPVESDIEVVRSYFSALIEGAITENRNPFLYSIATHHVKNFSSEILQKDFKDKLLPESTLYRQLFS